MVVNYKMPHDHMQHSCQPINVQKFSVDEKMGIISTVDSVIVRCRLCCTKLIANIS